MTSLLEPSDPDTLFLIKGVGRQLFYMSGVIMPPNSQVTVSVAPSTDMIWVVSLNTTSPARDAATGNIVNSALIYSVLENSMITHTTIYAFDSYHPFQWPNHLFISANDPLVHTVVNNSAVTVTIDATIMVIEIPTRFFEGYLKLWKGIENMLTIAGKYSLEDIPLVAKMLMALFKVGIGGEYSVYLAKKKITGSKGG